MTFEYEDEEEKENANERAIREAVEQRVRDRLRKKRDKAAEADMLLDSRKRLRRIGKVPITPELWTDAAGEYLDPVTAVATFIRNVCVRVDTHADFVATDGVECIITMLQCQRDRDVRRLLVSALADVIPYCTVQALDDGKPDKQTLINCLVSLLGVAVREHGPVEYQAEKQKEQEEGSRTSRTQSKHADDSAWVVVVVDSLHRLCVSDDIKRMIIYGPAAPRMLQLWRGMEKQEEELPSTASSSRKARDASGAKRETLQLSILVVVLKLAEFDCVYGKSLKVGTQGIQSIVYLYKEYSELKWKRRLVRLMRYAIAPNQTARYPKHEASTHETYATTFS